MNQPLRALLMLVVAALPAMPGVVQAQQKFPTKPIRFVVPFSPGGGTDTLARIIAQKMSENWGQSVVIENRTGAGGWSRWRWPRRCAHPSCRTYRPDIETFSEVVRLAGLRAK